MSSSPAEPIPYMLLFRNSGPDIYRDLTPDESQQLVSRWNGWFDALLEQGKALDGQPLEVERRVVSGRDGSRIVDGPFPEAKEAVGGFVTLLVSGLDEATRIAQSHPALHLGLIIEVREITAGCHLGVKSRPRAKPEPAKA